MHTLILHGWSDSSSSFAKIKKLLILKKLGTIETILYVDYESREDSMTFNDIVDGFNDKLIKRGIISPTGKKKKEVNVIIHSTGGLIIRHYIWRYYRDRLHECPIKRIVMLAPANFGSPLAHYGKSFFVSLIKGRWKFGDFLELGCNILSGLELASPYQWELAHNDLFREKSYYPRLRPMDIYLNFSFFPCLGGKITPTLFKYAVILPPKHGKKSKIPLNTHRSQSRVLQCKTN